MSDKLPLKIERIPDHPNGPRPMWDYCPIFRLKGGPYDGLLRELCSEANAICFGATPGQRASATYCLVDGLLHYQEPKDE